MGLMAWLTLVVLVVVLVLLIVTQLAPDLVLLGGVTILLVCGVLSPADAFAGMANEGVITIAALFVVAAGMRETGGMHILVKRILGQPHSLVGAQARMRRSHRIRLHRQRRRPAVPGVGGGSPVGPNLFELFSNEHVVRRHQRFG